jgi:hypothetical protein
MWNVLKPNPQANGDEYGNSPGFIAASGARGVM